MSIKIKHAIENCLKSIEQKTFDENTIRTLLITSREYLKIDSLIRELAHFIAHPKRNQGIFHKKVNSRYTKFKLVQSHVLNFDLNYIREKISTEDELSDFMLGGIDVNKVEEQIFKILYKDGLEDIEEDHLLKYTGFTKNQAEEVLNSYYTKNKNYYYLNVLETEKRISLLQTLPEDGETNTLIQNATELVSKIRTRIDILQKVLRGYIHFNSVFDEETLSNEFQNSFSEVLTTFEIDKSYLPVIAKNIDDILLCLMTLLHDSKFIFYDKNESNIFLCLHTNSLELSERKSNQSETEFLYENGALALYLTCYTYEQKTLSFPLFVSRLKIKNYLSFEEFINNDVKGMLEPIPWITASRFNGILKLIE